MNLCCRSFVFRPLLKATPWLAVLALLGAVPGQAVEGDAWVGVMLQELSPPLRDAMDLEAGVDGVVIAGVVPQSPALKAGLEEGDLILSIDGRDVSTVEEAMDRVRARKSGDKSDFTVQRDGKRREVSVTLGRREDSEDLAMPDDPKTHGNLAMPDARRAPRGPLPPARPGRPPSPPVPPDTDKDFSWFDEDAPGPERHREMIRMFAPGEEESDRGYLGVSTIDLGDQLSAYFEVPTDRGVLVTEVAEDSPAEAAGIRAGDVILALNKSGVDSPRDLLRLVRAHDPKDQVEIEVKRKGATLMLQATLGEAEDMSELEPAPWRMFLRGMDRLPRHLQQLGQHLEHLKGLDTEHLEHLKGLDEEQLEHLKGLDDEHFQRRIRIVHHGSGSEI